MVSEPEVVGADAVAEELGITTASVRVRLQRARERRAAGRAGPADLPEPDAVGPHGATGWTADTYRRWRAAAGLDTPPPPAPRAREVPRVVGTKWMAEDLGVQHKTVLTYHKTAARRRRDGTSRPGDLPEPDATFGRTLGWKARTYLTWKTRRPGRGKGGGNPGGGR